MISNKFKIKDIGSLLKETYKEFNSDEPFEKSAALSYYAIFSLPAIVVIVIFTAGLVFGEETIQREITNQIESNISPDAAKEISTMLQNSLVKDTSIWAAIVGIATLIFGATGVFAQLQRSLNAIWEIRPVPEKALVKLLKDRAFSFGIVVVIAFLLLISLVLTTAIGVLGDWIASNISEAAVPIFKVINIVVSFAIVTILFAAIYKILPDAELKWKDVIIGAIITSFLFVLGKYGLSLYFQYSSPTSTFGAAGTIILIMLWVNYASLILFFGAEFTEVFARRYGGDIKPSEHAEKIEKTVTSSTTKQKPIKKSDLAHGQDSGTNVHNVNERRFAKRRNY